MSEQLRRLDLFEGILIGIYGNWLISLVEKITFTKVLVLFGFPLWWYQPFCIVFSFVSLILLIGFGIFRPDYLRGKVGRFWVLVLSFGHIMGISLALRLEVEFVQNYFFFGVGGLFFLLIYGCELIRIKRISERRKRKKWRYKRSKWNLS